MNTFQSDNSVKDFVGNVCDKSLKNKSNLIVHKKIHSGEKPYKCDVCEKRFLHKSDIKRHILVHSGQKEFKCNICKKDFYESII